VEPALHAPQDVNTLFVDHICLAAVAHFAWTYGAYKPRRPGTGTRLSPRQEQLVKEMIEVGMDGDVRLADLAAACGLSVSHFSRAFRATTGMPPHRWLLARRVEVAKTLLAGSRRTIAEVALEVGFFDQSHFKRVVTRNVGTSPVPWRRARM
jgi:AraC family transcriptional regulator